MRARYLFRERREKSLPTDPVLTASQEYGVISQAKYEQITGNRVTAPLRGTEAFQHVAKGDFVISLRTFEGGIEYAHQDGCISPAYTVLKPTVRLHGGFFRYLFKSSVFLSILRRTVTGIRDGKSVKYDDFADLVLPWPSLKTQGQISDFLDRETERIDRLIVNKTHLMHLLEEKWQASVSTVLDRIGAAGAPITKLGYLVTKVGSGRTPRGGAETYVDSGVRFLRSQNVHNDGLRLEKVAFISSSVDSEMSATRVREGDVLLNITGASLGRSAVATKAALPANVSQHVCIIRPARSVMPAFLHLCLCSPQVQTQIRLHAFSANREGLTVEDVRNLRVLLPPPDVQRQACIWARGVGDNIVAAKAVAARSVQLLREFRSALITAAVTGQIDVDQWRRRGETDRHLEEMEAAGADT